MSDYLDDLVARSLDLVRTVEPRLGSRFETPPSAFAPAQESPFEVTSADTTQDAREPNVNARPADFIATGTQAARSADKGDAEIPPTAPRRADLPTRRASEPTGVPYESRASDSAAQSPTAHASRPHGGEHPSRGERERRGAAASSEQTLDDIVRQPPADAARQRRGAHTRPSAPMIPPPSDDASTEAGASSEAFDGRAHRGSTPPRTPARERDGARKRNLRGVADESPAAFNLPTPRGPVAAAGERHTQRSHAAEPLASPAEAPTVRIHIGRIEVRAISQTPPPPPARPAAPARPALTLEEYLKRRSGGQP